LPLEENEINSQTDQTVPEVSLLWCMKFDLHKRFFRFPVELRQLRKAEGGCADKIVGTYQKQKYAIKKGFVWHKIYLPMVS
jgi:hypothetical protein